MSVNTINNPSEIEVDIIESLGDVPIVTGEALRRKFDEGGKNIKNYLAGIVPDINAAITQVNSNSSSINTVTDRVGALETSNTSHNNQDTKVYVNATTSTPTNTAPQIRFVKSTAPTMSNYGASLPVGSIVLVYD